MIKTLFLIILVSISFVIFVRYIEVKSTFVPTKDIPTSPQYISLDYEDVYFKTKDNLKLNGWFIKNPKARSTLLFFHGNAGNVSHRLDKIAMFYHLGLNVFIVDYRGYGRSEGSPSEEGMYKDAVAAYDYLVGRADIDKNRIIGYGASLGGAAAVDLALKRKLACLIIDSSLSCAADVSKAIYPFIPAFLLKQKLDSVNKVKKISMPKLFIHSINDEIIPYRLGKKLFDSAALPKEFLEVAGGHNTSYVDSREKYIAGINSFLNKLGLLVFSKPKVRKLNP